MRTKRTYVGSTEFYVGVPSKRFLLRRCAVLLIMLKLDYISYNGLATPCIELLGFLIDSIKKTS